MSSRLLTALRWVSPVSFSALGILSITSTIYLSLAICHYLSHAKQLSSIWDQWLIPVAWLSSLLSAIFFYRAWKSSSEGASVQERAVVVKKQLKLALLSGMPFYWAIAFVGSWLVFYSFLIHGYSAPCAGI